MPNKLLNKCKHIEIITKSPFVLNTNNLQIYFSEHERLIELFVKCVN